ncbi:hypothetical protein OK016_00885 [Vibrio chagasii]|nr:hypothetical protein [Vibrio chagasii]
MVYLFRRMGLPIRNTYLSTLNGYWEFSDTSAFSAAYSYHRVVLIYPTYIASQQMVRHFITTLTIQRHHTQNTNDLKPLMKRQLKMILQVKLCSRYSIMMVCSKHNIRRW